MGIVAEPHESGLAEKAVSEPLRLSGRRTTDPRRLRRSVITGSLTSPGPPEREVQRQFVAGANDAIGVKQIWMPVGLLVVGRESSLAIDHPGGLGPPIAQPGSQRSRRHAKHTCNGTIGRSQLTTVEKGDYVLEF